MMLTKEEAKELGFEYIYYNPYSTKKDRVGLIMIGIIVFICFVIGTFTQARLMLAINTIIALAVISVVITDLFSSEKI